MNTGIQRSNQGRHPPHPHPAPHQIQILVNGKPVVVHEKELTGLKIKEAAINQGVQIQLDFVLFEDLSNGKQVIVRDEQDVKLHEHQRFEAITNDDNS
jgi:hypothetical protein